MELGSRIAPVPEEGPLARERGLVYEPAEMRAPPPRPMVSRKRDPMQTVLLVIHIMIAATLVGVVLMQRSEGGALGIGGGGFMTGRGAANALTRLTAYLATGFFATSIALALLANHQTAERSVFDAPAGATAPATPGAPAATGDAPATPPSRGGVLDKLQQPGGGQAPAPRVPQGQ